MKNNEILGKKNGDASDTSIIQRTLSNIETHLKNERQALYGMFMGTIPGGTCQIHTSDRSYRIDYIIDEKIERFFVDAYPQIVCEGPYRQMMHAYVNEKTSSYKSGRIDIDEGTGEVKIRVESPLVDQPITVNTIKDMEHLSIHICDGLERRLDKMAHGVYFKEDDPELMSAVERKFASLKKSLSPLEDDTDDSIDEFLEMLESDDDDRDGDIVPDDQNNSDESNDDVGDNSNDVGAEEATENGKSFDDLFPEDDPDDDA